MGELVPPRVHESMGTGYVSHQLHHLEQWTVYLIWASVLNWLWFWGLQLQVIRVQELERGRAGRMTSSDTSRAQIRGSELVHLNIYPINEPLELIKDLVL